MFNNLSQHELDAGDKWVEPKVIPQNWDQNRVSLSLSTGNTNRSRKNLGKRGFQIHHLTWVTASSLLQWSGLGLEYRILQLHQEFFFVSQQFPSPMARFLYKTMWNRRTKSSKFSRGGGYQADSMHFDDALINAQWFFSLAEIYF